MFVTLEHVLRSFDEGKFQDVVVRARSDLCPVERFTSEALQSLISQFQVVFLSLDTLCVGPHSVTRGDGP